LRHDLTSTTAKPTTNGPSYTTRWDVTPLFAIAADAARDLGTRSAEMAKRKSSPSMGA
jgi:hypothetical protein